MTLFHLFLIALIQGITEFLPISSSGHLILLPSLTGMPDQGAVIDVAAHVGTLVAVVAYFWRDVGMLLRGTASLVRGRVADQAAFLALAILIATIPVIVIGAALKLTGMVDHLRSVTVIGWTMLLFGIVLYYVDQKQPQDTTMDRMTLRHAITLGLWQAVALLPGTSRSGIVITGARSLGFTRVQAARVSMLMSIPTILASGTLASLDLIGGQVAWRDALIVAGLSAIAALLALAVMFRLLTRISYAPYVIYRVVFGLILLAVGYSGVLT